ncbi:MAG TPA: RnfH family protein [Burkholderiales bacterium]|nr:RnfH family protein [Burkholderiales bacterium]
MKVEVVFARPEGAETVRVELPPGATVRDALAASGFQLLKDQPMGIFGKRVALDQPLASGDRVEIYRPLAMDPKEARRRRARAKR